MTAARAHLRGLALIVIVLATMAMHAGLSGACHASGSGGAPRVMTASAVDMVEHSAPHGPAAPRDADQTMAQACQATLPSAAGLVGALAAISVLALALTAPSLPSRKRAASRPWWPPPPGRSALCIWRI